jgi:hypothetical protein
MLAGQHKAEVLNCPFLPGQGQGFGNLDWLRMLRPLINSGTLRDSGVTYSKQKSGSSGGSIFSKPYRKGSHGRHRRHGGEKVLGGRKIKTVIVVSDGE